MRRLAFCIVAAAAILALTGEPIVRPLYISFGALQALDIASTARVINNGGHEENPVVAKVWGSPGGVLAVKAAATAGVVYAAERLRKSNPKAALLFMIGANSVMATIVAHNYTASRR
ncbi:MAG TPA: DUF5658 family protein [Vicinamibacterales bacterium]|nr:DUF5658 family protein [Vicinamibacterales bacterium]